MFTGIVEEMGRVRSVEPNNGGVRAVFEADVVLGDVALGASIAVNGVCLTVVAFDRDARWWAADAVFETIERTTLGDLGVGDAVNLERPMRLEDRLGGHLVQGHVDGTGMIVGRDAQPDGSVTLRVDAGAHVLRSVIEKGSITVDGISLTVVTVDADGFTIAVIPHTQAVTTLGKAQIGTRVNLECDVIAKYVAKLAAPLLAGRDAEGD